jgi:6-pyruvoyltetrahydropterin/6-carboxytetrahydropterin synthase
VNFVTTVASDGFEAARHVSVLPAGHRCRGLHGHSFQASAFASLDEGWAPFPGAEIAHLKKRLKGVLSKLDYVHLNTILDEPTDENVARWIREQLSLSAVDRIAVQSTDTQGVDLDRDGLAHVWRKYSFQAAHQLPNVPPGHKCGRMHGHGFEVIVHAKQSLGSNAISIDYDHLDNLWAPFEAILNFQCLNHIDGLGNPTSEVIAQWLWTRLRDSLPQLSCVTVFETETCGAHFDGVTYRIWKEFSLDSAVQLRRAPATSSHARVHGRTFRTRLHISAPLDLVMGWTIDYGDVKDTFAPLFKQLDHHPLHESVAFSDTDTSSIAKWLFDTTRELLPQLTAVDLFETRGCGTSISTDPAVPTLPV